jgi:hypothetical protein
MIAGAEGGCDCGKVRYRIKAEPIFVNCCHCRLCQRQTGSAFAINVLIEAEHVELLGEEPTASQVMTPSGHGQAIMRCRHCGVAVWSVYGGAGDKVRFVKGGTLDDSARVVPVAHIFTESKLPWVTIPEGAAQFPGFYSGRDLIPTFGEESAARWRAVLSR